MGEVEQYEQRKGTTKGSKARKGPKQSKKESLDQQALNNNLLSAQNLTAMVEDRLNSLSVAQMAQTEIQKCCS